MLFTKNYCKLFSKIGEKIVEERDYSKDETELLEHAVDI